MRRITSIASALLIAALLGGTSGSFAEDDIAGRVGDYGDQGRLTVEGTAAFPAATIVEALRKNFNVLVAAHPLAPLGDYLSTIKQKTLAGYRHEGFADVTAGVRVDQKTGRIVVTVKEGLRFTADDVIIETGEQIDVPRFIERLTSPYPPENATPRSFQTRDGKAKARWYNKDGEEVKLKDPIWRRGKPAHFDRPAMSKFRRKISRAFSDFGYPFATFEVDLIAVPIAKTADLLVKINQLGPRAVANQIIITGNQRDSDEEIIDYLDVQPGTVITHRECDRISQELWRSGRFLKFKVTPVLSQVRQNTVDLQIELTDFSKAPKLTEQLSREEQTLLKLRDWLADSGNWEGDLVVRAQYKGALVEVILSPLYGLLFSVAMEDDGGISTIISSRLVGAYSTSRREKLTGKAGRVHAMANLTFSALDPASGKTVNTMVGMGIESLKADEDVPPFKLSLSLDPAAFIGMANWDGVEYAFSDGKMTATSETGGRCVVDVRTGHLLEYKHVGNEEKGDSASGYAVFEKGAFDAKVREIETTARDYKETFDLRRPVSSLLAFLCQEPLLAKVYELKPEQRHGLDVMCKIIDKGVLQPIDDIVTSGILKSKADNFDIPDDHSDLAAAAAANPLAIFAPIVLPYCSKLFPYDSWPWTIGREATLVVAGKSQYTGAVLGKLYSGQENGPLCFYCTARLLEMINPPAAEQFARRGLEELSVESFRKDYRILLDPNCAAGRSVLKIAEVLRDLDAKDVKLLDQALFNGKAELLKDCAKELRRQRNQPIAKILPEVLDKAWDEGLKQQVETALKTLKQRNERPEKPLTRPK